MKDLRRNYPILVSIVLTVLFPLISLLGSLPLLLWDMDWLENIYLAQLLSELVLLALMILAALVLRMGYVFRRSRKSAAANLVPVLPIALFYTFALWETLILCSEEPLRPPLQALWFFLCMMAVGLAEELTFRGLITRMIYEKYGYTSVGVWFSVVVSSLLFGAVHLSNAAGGTMELGGVLVQMVGAAALGMCLAAIYLRTRSLWTVALLHGYMDICALISTGVYKSDTLQEIVGSYSAANLIAAAAYGALALFLLRPSQMKKITDSKAQPPQNHVIGLMLAVMLLAGLASAVTVLTV